MRIGCLLLAIELGMHDFYKDDVTIRCTAVGTIPEATITDERRMVIYRLTEQ
jgi:hypothetical protein